MIHEINNDADEIKNIDEFEHENAIPYQNKIPANIG